MGMICCANCGRMVAGALDICPFCNKILAVPALDKPNRMSLEQLDLAATSNTVAPIIAGNASVAQPISKSKRFSNNPKVTDMLEWIAGRNKL